MRLTIKNTAAIEEHLQNVFDAYDLDGIYEAKDKYEFQFWNKQDNYYVIIELNRLGKWSDDANECQYTFSSGDTVGAEWFSDIYNAKWCLEDELEKKIAQ